LLGLLGDSLSDDPMDLSSLVDDMLDLSLFNYFTFLILFLTLHNAMTRGAIADEE
jgi:hypothetical protein